MSDLIPIFCLNAILTIFLIGKWYVNSQCPIARCRKDMGILIGQVSTWSYSKNMTPNSCYICKNEFRIGDVLCERGCEHAFHNECDLYRTNDHCKSCLPKPWYKKSVVVNTLKGWVDARNI